MPEDVQDILGKALLEVQRDHVIARAKPLRGFGGASVLEIPANDDQGCTYRLVYTVKYSEPIYVLHLFQKKSHHDDETPREDKGLIKQRLAMADAHYADLQRSTNQ